MKKRSVVAERTVRRLKREMPLRYPVRVQLVERLVVDGDRIIGECAFDDEQFVIRLLAGLKPTLMEATVIHEWAHARAWPTDAHRHGDEWGRQYAMAWRAVKGGE